MRRCSRCGKLKNDDDFHRHKTNVDGYSHICKQCILSEKKAKRDARRAYDAAVLADAHKNANLRLHYGMTLEDYDARLAGQEGVCAICGRGPEGFQRSFAVDHDHTSGRVRGILCPDCNRGLGGFRDDPVLLQKAIEYLTKIEPE